MDSYDVYMWVMGATGVVVVLALAAAVRGEMRRASTAMERLLPPHVFRDPPPAPKPVQQTTADADMAKRIEAERQQLQRAMEDAHDGHDTIRPFCPMCVPGQNMNRRANPYDRRRNGVDRRGRFTDRRDTYPYTSPSAAAAASPSNLEGSERRR